MDTYDWTMLFVAQALQVSLLLLVVACVNHLWARNRPHLAHALWLIVLLKCIAPPFWNSPSSLFSWLSTGVSSMSYAEAQPRPATATNPGREAASGVTPSVPVREPTASSSTARAAVSLRSVVQEPSSSAQKDVSTHQPLRIILTIVCIGFVFGFTRAIVRFTLFLRIAYRSGYEQDVAITATVDRLRHRLGIRRRVRVHLIQAPIGPAVVGLIRPTLLLPKLLVTGSCEAQLEPLLAHELIHVRRGDLWWSIVQALATYLWWFHPGVRYASRMATLEAERSCDEETVSSLGCSPATYARALLDVLERKHQLLIAPGLPGVRPVDITLHRMERIMQLGQRGHRRSPRWVWFLLFVLSALVLPSAALSKPQDDPLPAGPIPPATGPIANGFESYRLDVGDLLDALQKNNFTPDEARREILRRIPQRDTAKVGGVSSDLGLPGGVVVNLPAPEIVGRELRGLESKDRVNAIKTKLEKYRKSRFRESVSDLRLYECSLADYEELLKSFPGLVSTFEAESVFSTPSIEILGEKDPFKSDVLGAETIVVERAERIALASGKWLTAKQGQTLAVDTSKNAIPNAFIVDAKGLSYLSSQAGLRPQGGSGCVQDSWRIVDSRMISQRPQFGNGKATITDVIKIPCKLVPTERESWESTLEFSFQPRPSGVEFTDKQAADKPEFRMKVRGELSDGQTLVLGGIRTKPPEQEKLFLVTLTMTLQGLAPPRLQIALLQLKELASARPIPIIGLVTKPGEITGTERPTDDELTRALELYLPDLRNLLDDKRIQFELRKTGERVDPARNVPLLGPAKLHHVFYDCSITCAAYPEIIGTLKIDHNHFELVENN